MEGHTNDLDKNGKISRIKAINESLLALENQLANAKPVMEISIKTSINNLRRELAELENEINHQP
jgi:hypothetical protein